MSKRQRDIAKELKDLHKRQKKELDELIRTHHEQVHAVMEKVLRDPDELPEGQSMNDFGNEDWSYLSAEALLHLFAMNRDGILEAVRKIYFDPDHPENRTVRKKSVRANSVLVCQGGQWVVADLKETAQAMQKRAASKLWSSSSHQLRAQVERDIDELGQDAIYAKYMNSYWPLGIGLKPGGELNDKAEQDLLTRKVEFLIINSAECRPVAKAARLS